MGPTSGRDLGIGATHVIAGITWLPNVHRGVFPKVNWVRPPPSEDKLAIHPIPGSQGRPGFGKEGGPVVERGGPE